MNTYNQRQTFSSPPNNQRSQFQSSPIHQSRAQFQSSPIHQARPQFQTSPIVNPNNFQPRSSPYVRSPGYNSRSNWYADRNKSSYNQVHTGVSTSFSNSTGSPEQWNSPNVSLNSSSSSYFGDVSQLSPYNSSHGNNRNVSQFNPFNSSHRNSRSPYSQNRNMQYQGKLSFQSPESNDSNPGHLDDIKLYVDSSMLEDPWKDLMAEIDKKN